MVKTIAGLLGLFYLNGRDTMRSQHVGNMIAKSKRHRQHAGREIRSYLNRNYRNPMDGGQPYPPSCAQSESVRILLAHFNQSIGKELSL